MYIKEIEEFAQYRDKARAYFCYMLSRVLPNRLPGITLKDLKTSIRAIVKTIKNVEAVYILNPSGKQVINTISLDKQYARKGMGESRSKRIYFSKVMKEKKCILTDPYPSINSNKLIVTVAYPIFNEKNEIIYIVCIDISLDKLLGMINIASIDSISGKVIRVVYGAFTLALFFVAILLFIKGVYSFFELGSHFYKVDIKNVFESTILITLSLAIFDLVKAMFEEEVLGEKHKEKADDIHKTMVKFLGSIIIALAIEALMLVFKFALTDSSKLLYAVYLILGITALLIGLSIYLKSLNKKV